MIVLDDETDKFNISPQAEVNFPAQLRKAEHNDGKLYLPLNDRDIVGSPNTTSNTVDTGAPYRCRMILFSSFAL